MSEKLIDIVKHPQLLFLTLGHREWFNWLEDETYLKIAYRAKMGKNLNLSNPKTFNEKLQWLKLYDRQPLYPKLVDKYEVKSIIAERIGEEYIIPTLGVWNKFEDIDFSKLPERFVLKCTHDSGGLIVVKDKSKLDLIKAQKKINKCLSHSFFWGMREWPYKDVKPRILAEKYMEDESGKELKDYKFFCFSGKVKFLKVDFGRFVEHHANYYDTEMNLLPFGEDGLPPIPDYKINKPKNFESMIELAEVLSREIPFLRVDFYNINGNIYFGELTFYPASGMGKFTSDEWDLKIGEYINLPINLSK